MKYRAGVLKDRSLLSTVLHQIMQHSQQAQQQPKAETQQQQAAGEYGHERFPRCHCTRDFAMKRRFFSVGRTLKLLSEPIPAGARRALHPVAWG
jgi:hypothetical protein